jgi:hypothetical protein
VSTPADKIAAIFREKAAPLIAKNFHVARYELLDPTKSNDGQGGRIRTPAVIETGRCSLDQSDIRGQDRQEVSVAIAEGAYMAELPITSKVKASHKVRITVPNRPEVGENEIRTFNIIGQPLKGDDSEMFITVYLELDR